jgi:hypothetical protein
MPITPAHAAAAVPLARLGLPALALVVGTQVPDLPMLFPAITLSYGVTHSYLLGLPVDTAYGLLLWLLCEWIRPAAVALLPEPLRCRLSSHASSSYEFGARTLAALALGSLSHLLWDELTHEGRWGARHLALLRAHWGFAVPGYKWLQYGTGALALAFLALWSSRRLQALPVRQDVAKRWRTADRRAIVVTLLVLVPTASLARAGLRTTNTYDFAFLAVTTLMASELLALVLARAWFERSGASEHEVR